MGVHPVLLVLHILSGVVWLSLLPADIVIRSAISRARGQDDELSLISVYLKLANLTGIVGMLGILITGIMMVSFLPYYNFFDFSANHWLASKQVLTILLIIIVFAFLIPTAKQIRKELSSNQAINEVFYKRYNKLTIIITVINIIVLLNFLFAITHRFFG